MEGDEQQRGMEGENMSIFDFFKRKKQGKQAIEPSLIKTEDPDEIITSLKEQKLLVSEEQAVFAPFRAVGK